MKVFLINGGDHDDEYHLCDDLEILAQEPAGIQARFLIEIPYTVYTQYIQAMRVSAWWESCIAELCKRYPAVGD